MTSVDQNLTSRRIEPSFRMRQDGEQNAKGKQGSETALSLVGGPNADGCGEDARQKLGKLGMAWVCLLGNGVEVEGQRPRFL